MEVIPEQMQDKIQTQNVVFLLQIAHICIMLIPTYMFKAMWLHYQEHRLYSLQMICCIDNEADIIIEAYITGQLLTVEPPRLTTRWNDEILSVSLFIRQTGVLWQFSLTNIIVAYSSISYVLANGIKPKNSPCLLSTVSDKLEFRHRSMQ